MCRIPQTFKNFKCSASACTDNCCIGWEIDIDGKTAKKYMDVTGDFANELKNGIDVAVGNLCFKLVNGRCYFLDENNLCKIYKTLGRDALCNICREHPRFYNELGNISEMGLGLQCEEAVKLLFAGDGITKDDVSYEKNLSQTSFEDERAAVIFELRDKIFSYIYDETLTLSEVFKKAASDASEAQRRLFGDGYLKADILKCNILLGFMGDMEPIDENWAPLIKKMRGMLPVLIETANDTSLFGAERKMQYRKVFSYLLYRHLFDAVFDGEAVARTSFCIDFVHMLRLLDAYVLKETGAFSQTDAINTVKYLSKQIEYSEENTELLMFA